MEARSTFGIILLISLLLAPACVGGRGKVLRAGRVLTHFRRTATTQGRQEGDDPRRHLNSRGITFPSNRYVFFTDLDDSTQQDLTSILKYTDET